MGGGGNAGAAAATSSDSWGPPAEPGIVADHTAAGPRVGGAAVGPVTTHAEARARDGAAREQRRRTDPAAPGNGACPLGQDDQPASDGQAERPEVSTGHARPADGGDHDDARGRFAAAPRRGSSPRRTAAPRGCPVAGHAPASPAHPWTPSRTGTPTRPTGRPGSGTALPPPGRTPRAGSPGKSPYRSGRRPSAPYPSRTPSHRTNSNPSAAVAVN